MLSRPALVPSLVALLALGAEGPGRSQAPPREVPKPAPAAKRPAVPRDSSAGLRRLGQKALKAPEHLLFDITWGGWNFRWINAGRASLDLQPTADPQQWRILSLAWCNSFFQSFYPVRDTVMSYIDTAGIYPRRFEKHLHEGTYHTALEAVFDQAAHRVRTQDTAFGVAPFTHDVLSAFYFLRTQELREGHDVELAAVSGKKQYLLRVICHGREDVTVPAGEFHAIVVEPVLKDDGLFKAKGKLTIWLTDDAFHIPVKMQSKIPVGSIKAELVSRR